MTLFAQQLPIRERLVIMSEDLRQSDVDDLYTSLMAGHTTDAVAIMRRIDALKASCSHSDERAADAGAD